MICPRCNTSVLETARFCGSCGALVTGPDGPPDPSTSGTPPLVDGSLTQSGADLDRSDGDGAPPERVRMRRAMAVASVTLALVSLVIAQAVKPVPEIVTADGGAGADGDGVTSTHAVEDVSSERWHVPGDAFAGTGGFWRWESHATDLDGTLLALVGDHLIAIDGGARQVLWRSPAIEGTPTAVDARLPVVSGSELLWLRSIDGAIEDRHEFTGVVEETVVAANTAFALPAAGLLVTPAGPSVMDHRGVVRWARHGDGRVVGIHGGVVVIQDGPNLLGLSLDTGETGWEVNIVTIDRPGRFRPSDTRLTAGTVVAIDDRGNIIGIDPVTGVRRWQSPLPGTTKGDAAEMSSRFVGSDGDVVFLSHHGPGQQQLLRVATSDGEVEDVDVGSDVPRSVAVWDDVLITSAGTGTIRAHRDGQLLWSTEAEVPPATASVVGDTIASIDRGGLQLLDPRTGEVTLSVEAHSTDPRPRRPAVLDGHAIIFGRGMLRGVDLTTGETGWETPVDGGSCCPSHLVGNGHIVVAGPLRVFDATGAEKWSDPDSMDVGPAVSAIVGPWVVTDQYSDHTDTVQTRLRSLQHGRPGLAISTTTSTLRDVVQDADRFYATTSVEGKRAVVAVPLPPADTTDTTLTPVWTISAHVHTQLIRSGDDLLIVTPANIERRDPATGQLRGRTPLPTLMMPGAALHQDIIIGLAREDTVVAVDLATGDLRWTRTFEPHLTSSPTIAGDHVYLVDARSTVHVISLDDGTETTSVTVRAPAAGPVTIAHGVMLVPTETHLHAFGPPVPGPSPTGGSR